MPLGLPLKIARKLLKWRLDASKLASRISTLESECAVPILSSFSGAARYDAARRFFDAGLICRLRSAPDAERGTITETYLQRCYEEYVMARQDLGAQPATRAEIAALGLALRELTLMFDREVASFRSRTAADVEVLAAAVRQDFERVAEQLQQDARAYAEANHADTAKRIHHVLTDTAAAHERLREELSAIDARQSEISVSLAALRSDVTNQLEAQRATTFDVVQACENRMTAALRQYKLDTDAQQESVRQTMSAQYAELKRRYEEEISHVTVLIRALEQKVAQNEAATTTLRSFVTEQFQHVTAKHDAAVQRFKRMFVAALCLGVISLAVAVMS